MNLSERIEAAKERGKDAGESAASWVFDGNTTDATYREVLRGIEDGDPAVTDRLSWSPLSGEWAGESIKELLGDLIEADEDDATEDYNAEDDEAEVTDAYEQAAQDAYWSEIERAARAALAPDDNA